MSEPIAGGAGSTGSAGGADATDDIAGLHNLLLRLAAHLPDQFLPQYRAWLAERELGRLASFLCATVANAGTPLFPGEGELLSAVLARAGADVHAVDAIEIDEDEVEYAPRCYFSATRSAAAGPDTAVDVTADPAVLAAVVDAAGRDDLIGLWRAWRIPADGAPWPGPRWIHLLELAPTADLAAVTGRVQQALAAAGATDPLVEAFASRQELPVYQRFALGDGDLVWANTPDVTPAVARVFDFADPEGGPGFADDHERIEDQAEIERIVGYLDAGEMLMSTLSMMPDVVDPEHPVTVPMDFRTDGAWIWPDTVQYYLSRHRLAPDPDLLRHIREVGYEATPLTAVDLHRAMRVLRQPAEEEPAWTYEPA